MSILLTGGTVVRSLVPARVERTDLLVSDGHVLAVGLNQPTSGVSGTLDCGGCLIVPGNTCAHTHAYSALARGMPFSLAAPTSFLEILQRVWWRLDRALDLETIRASALVAAQEAALHGTTTLVDHHASPNAIDGSLDVIAEAFEEVGLRGVLCYETTDRDGATRARAGVDENARFLERVADGRWPLARGMVGAHASFTLSDETLGSCVQVARRHGVGLHIHAAEDAVDEADALARFGTRVVPRLHGAGALDERALLAHGVHLDPAEAAQVRAARATVVHNPRSNMNNGVGRAPLGWLAGRLALGTDGIGADMFAEAVLAYLRHREEDVTADTDVALDFLAGSAHVAARAFAERSLGQLDPGAPADLAVLAYDAPAPLDGAGNLAGHWVFGISGAAVRDVMVAGELIVRNGRLTRVDATEVAMEARRAAHRLWDRMADIGPHPFEPTRLLATAGSGDG